MNVVEFIRNFESVRSAKRMIRAGNDEVRWMSEHVHVHRRSALRILAFGNSNRRKPENRVSHDGRVQVGSRGARTALPINREYLARMRVEFATETRLQYF